MVLVVWTSQLQLSPNFKILCTNFQIIRRASFWSWLLLLCGHHLKYGFHKTSKQYFYTSTRCKILVLGYCIPLRTGGFCSSAAAAAAAAASSVSKIICLPRIPRTAWKRNQKKRSRSQQHILWEQTRIESTSRTRGTQEAWPNSKLISTICHVRSNAQKINCFTCCRTRCRRHCSDLGSACPPRPPARTASALPQPAVPPPSEQLPL